MIDGWLKHYYDRYRAKGYTMSAALRYAKIEDRFTDLEAEGLVQLNCEPGDHYYEDDFDIDGDSHLSAQAKEHAKRELADLIEREGYWIWFGQARLRDSDKWEYADNIGGIIGSDLGLYKVNLMQSAIDEFDRMVSDESDELAKRVTYAGA